MAAKSLVEPPNASQPHEGLMLAAPKHPKMVGRDITRAPPQGGLHSLRKIFDVQIRLAGLQEHTDLKEATQPGCPTWLVGP
jgi:hypothetical protein